MFFYINTPKEMYLLLDKDNNSNSLYETRICENRQCKSSKSIMD